MGRKAIDVSGQRFGRLLVQCRATGDSHACWKCSCDCGNEIVVKGSHLRNGNTNSCGCLKIELAGSYSITHGQTRGTNWSAEYQTWNGLKSRCYYKNNNRYEYYGGRGITVCDRWKDSFEDFLADMGPRPSPEHSIDRIDTNGNYEPRNCRWATRTEQANNRRNNTFYEFQGENLQLADWSEKVSIGAAALRSRINRGWSIEKALTTAVKGAT
jgi:hypothetical protein